MGISVLISFPHPSTSTSKPEPAPPSGFTSGTFSVLASRISVTLPVPSSFYVIFTLVQSPSNSVFPSTSNASRCRLLLSITLRPNISNSQLNVPLKGEPGENSGFDGVNSCVTVLADVFPVARKIDSATPPKRQVAERMLFSPSI